MFLEFSFIAIIIKSHGYGAKIEKSAPKQRNNNKQERDLRSQAQPKIKKERNVDVDMMNKV